MYPSRIKEIVTLKASELLNNEGNWRIHPQFQREGVVGLLEEVGKIDALTAYYSKREGGKLVLLNGHLRKSIDPDEEWTVIILDVDDEEADLILAHLDSLTTQAETDALKLDELLSRRQVQSEKMREAGQRLKEKIAANVAVAKRARGDADAPPKSKQSFDYTPVASVKIVVPVGDDLGTVEKALKATGEHNRGNALVTLCRNYLENAPAKS
jgi:hypothetical protein